MELTWTGQVRTPQVVNKNAFLEVVIAWIDCLAEGFIVTLEKMIRHRDAAVVFLENRWALGNYFTTFRTSDAC